MNIRENGIGENGIIQETDSEKKPIYMKPLIKNGTSMKLIEAAGKYNENYVYYGVYYGIIDQNSNASPTKISREDYNNKLEQIEGEQGKKYNFIKIENKYNDKVTIYFVAGIVSFIIIIIIVVIFLSDMNNTSIFLYSFKKL